MLSESSTTNMAVRILVVVLAVITICTAVKYKQGEKV